MTPLDPKTQAFKVGDEVFVFDHNRRQYYRAAPNELARIIYRAHFRKEKIVGETRVSWIVGHPDHEWLQKKFPKKRRLHQTWIGSYFFTAEQVDDECYAEANSNAICERVRKLRGPALKEVARIVGHQENPS